MNQETKKRKLEPEEVDWGDIEMEYKKCKELYSFLVMTKWGCSE